MARCMKLTWDGHPNYRWTIMYKSVRYRFSCTQLKCPRTKEGSYQAANEAWDKKKAQIDAASNTSAHLDYDDIYKAQQLVQIDRKISYAQQNMPDKVKELKIIKNLIKKSEPDEYIIQDCEAESGNPMDEIKENIRIADMCGIHVTMSHGAYLPLVNDLFGRGKVWNDRINRQKPPSEKFMFGNCVKLFLEEQQRNARPSTYLELSKYIALITNEAGIWSDQYDVSKINTETVNNFSKWLYSKNYTPGTHNKILGFFRRFVNWTVEDELLTDLPSNLFKKTLRKKISVKKVRSFDNVMEQINDLPIRIRFWTILAFNCGMGPVDLGNAKWEDIDQNNWTLTRRRVKTSDHKETPDVTYKLWPETIKLLQTLPYRNGHLFLTETGSIMYKSAYEPPDSTTVITTDLFSSYWNKLAKKPTFTLGKIRSIGSSIIENEPSGKFVSKHSVLYNGRMPRNIDEKNYLHNRLTFLDDALGYLRETLFSEPLSMAGVSDINKFKNT